MSACPHCGAPIFAVTEWSGNSSSTPPPLAQYTCLCRFDNSWERLTTRRVDEDTLADIHDRNCGGD